MLFGTKQTRSWAGIPAVLLSGHDGMNWTKFRIVAETEPLDEKSVDDHARWAKLADAVLKPGKNQSRARRRVKRIMGA